MKIKLYQIDAFAKEVFEGNSAAICPLNAWLSDTLMQKIALENNLSETAFFVKEDEILVFSSKSGDLHVRRDEEMFVMNFPAQNLITCKLPDAILEAFEVEPKECYKALHLLSLCRTGVKF